MKEIKQSSKDKIVILLLIGTLILSGCVASPKENSQCSNFCRDRGMDYQYVDSFVSGGPFCYCQIHMIDIENSQPQTFEVKK